MFYTYLGLTNGANTYAVTLKLFMRCNSGRQFPNPAVVSVFNKLTFDRISDIVFRFPEQETISITDTDPCITTPPTVCYVSGLL